MKEISIHEIENIKIGQVEDLVGGTGCTVFLSENGMAAGLDVRGGGPASRESELMKPLAAAQFIMPSPWRGDLLLVWMQPAVLWPILRRKASVSMWE